LTEARIKQLVDSGAWSPATAKKVRDVLVNDNVLGGQVGSIIPELTRILAENVPVPVADSGAQLPDPLKQPGPNPVGDYVNRRYNLKP
jgi:hypothetical protein